MFIKSLKLKTYKCFENKEVSFDSLNFIIGHNGAGKTTIIEAIIFALYGYTTQSLLSDIPTRNSAKTAFCELLIEKDEHLYRIIRQFPLKITIFKDNVLLKLSTTEANKFIIDEFDDRQLFFHFRLIDTNQKETNFLEEGPVALKKIIFAGTDEYFNNIRKKIAEIRLERERLNKDRVVVYKHYPSEKRLKILITNSVDISNSLVDLENELSGYEKDIRTLTYNISRDESLVEQNKKKADELNKDNITLVTKKICYTCKRPLEEHSAKQLQEEKEKQIQDLANEMVVASRRIKENETELKTVNEIKEQFQPQRQVMLDKKTKIQTLKMKLEARLQQKEYIYTENDVLIADRAITELDKMSSYYLVSTVQTLEPIINSVLAKISFSVKFDVDTKGKFNIVLTKNETQFKYKDLSCGERLILQIAFKIALLLQHNKTGILIADEGMSSLDSENLKHILTMFEDLPFQLVIILHHFNEFPDNANVIRLGE